MQKTHHIMTVLLCLMKRSYYKYEKPPRGLQPALSCMGSSCDCREWEAGVFLWTFQDVRDNGVVTTKCWRHEEPRWTNSKGLNILQSVWLIASTFRKATKLLRVLEKWW